MKIRVEQWPQNMYEIPVNPHDMHSCLVHGLFEENVEAGGKTRKYFTYLTDNLPSSSPCLIVAADAANSGAEFLQQSGLIELADKEKFFLHLLQPDDGCWDASGDADYMNQVYAQVQKRKYYVIVQENIYGLGIGDGTDLVHLAALREPENWSGIATIGSVGTDVAEEILSKENGVNVPKTPMPVWMMCQKIQEPEEAALHYWRHQNDSTESYMSDEYADRIYCPDFHNPYISTDDEKCAQVRVTVNVDGTSGSEERIPVLWNSLKQVRRHRAYAQKQLRHYMNWKDYGAEEHKITIDGYVRKWYEYVPERVKNRGEKVPLLIACHGRAQSPEILFDLSTLSRLAEERNIIVAFPQSGIYPQNEGSISNVPFWNGTYGGQEIDDSHFIRNLIQNIYGRNAIDMERIYACGFSSGGMMSSALSQTMKDVFAAVSCWSGFADLEKWGDNNKKTLVPTQLIMGTKDAFFADRTGTDFYGLDASITDSIRKRIEAYGLNQQPWIYQTGRILCNVHHNMQGVPLVEIDMVQDMVHAVIPFEGWMAYDQFLSKYSKDQNGNLYYMGKMVNP